MLKFTTCILNESNWLIYNILIKFSLIILVFPYLNIVNKCQFDAYYKTNFIYSTSSTNNLIQLLQFKFIDYFKFSLYSIYEINYKQNLGCMQTYSSMVANSLETQNYHTLKMFYNYACEGDLLKLQCPKNSAISIYTAYYGSLSRENDEKNLCSHSVSSKNYSHLLSSFKNNAIEIKNEQDKITCASFQAYKILDLKCSHHRNCTIPADANLFLTLDPNLIGQEAKLMNQTNQLLIKQCKSIATYAEVAYKCKPNSKSSKIICEDEKLHLSCSKNRVIMIYKAYYGSISEPYISECKSYEENNNNLNSIETILSNNHLTNKPYKTILEEEEEDECPLTNETDVLIKLCQGTRKCNFIANDQLFNRTNNEHNKLNACKKSIKKRLKVFYTCVLPFILTENRNLDAHILNETSNNLESKLNKVLPSSSLDENALFDSSLETNTKEIFSKSNNKINHFNLTGSPKIFESKEMHSIHGDEYNCTISNLKKSTIGFISEWVQAIYYMSGNIERLLLYFLVSILFALLCIVFIMTCKLRNDKKRVKSYYKKQQMPILSYVHNEEEDHLVSTQNSPLHYPLNKGQTSNLNSHPSIYSNNAQNVNKLLSLNETNMPQTSIKTQTLQQKINLDETKHQLNNKNLISLCEQFSNEQLLINSESSQFNLNEDGEIENEKEEEEEEYENEDNFKSNLNASHYKNVSIPSPRFLTLPNYPSPLYQKCDYNLNVANTKNKILPSTENQFIAAHPLINNISLGYINVNRPILNKSSPNLQPLQTSTNSLSPNALSNVTFLTNSSPQSFNLSLMPSSINGSFNNNKNSLNYEFNTIDHVPYTSKQDFVSSQNCSLFKQ